MNLTAPFLVLTAGIEPARLAASDFKSEASANSAMSANEKLTKILYHAAWAKSTQACPINQMSNLLQ